ncbi:MMPL family transporter [Ureibacillus chungkukjangi]|uniref:RND superfamily putative drug exporter n=1 Tax=Ureibacillus chungkukjangi TaxID=1202712 RepID=A0A318TH86_9BACL|nr:MMPL family transporter [Ureibacillus chungkukjangi]MCM3390360.1 MMPL family transporter [Ureibacillus chungkukjangi]PYF02458.1 RND superfamily putative drug exporter [Ureibacillus chungkukjangi]
MRKLLQAITDRVTTKKGMYVTLATWLIITIGLTLFTPSVRDYQVSKLETLPEDAKSIISQEKVDRYFEDSKGIPAILVFQSNNRQVNYLDIANILDLIESEKIEGLQQVVQLSKIPPQAATEFFSEDQTTALIPLTFDSSLETDQMKDLIDAISVIVKDSSDLDLYVTGPAGIATDTVELFTRADLVLIFSTVAIILVLLIVIYRSPLLAVIPLLGAAIVYLVVTQILGLMGKNGVLMSSQTISIMSILLFAAVIDYSLFVFSRYREELKTKESKYEAMRAAMKETGMPVFFSGGTVLVAMLVLFFAESGDYRNFAPTFATTMIIIMVASITLIPALFTLFGRKSFWPRIPKVDDQISRKETLWGKVGKFVAKKPGISVAISSIILLLATSNIFNLKYEFDTMKSFPDDMPSRQGYEVLEEKFDKGTLAPTTVLFESEQAVKSAEVEDLRRILAKQNQVSDVRINAVTEDQKVINYSLTFEDNPYANKTIDAMEEIINNGDEILTESSVEGNLYFAGETATKVDDRNINNRDIIVIVVLETILIFIMLIFLTKSFKMPIYMMGTILISFLAALGLGLFLSNLFFDISSISDRVPLYAFVFLVALGIDYNIILISRFQEERLAHSVKEAVEIAITNTGGVISSAGVILAATFAVLMTQPMELLFVFGFIVAVGILLDTFLIRGILLPGLIVLLEKDK